MLWNSIICFSLVVQFMCMKTRMLAWCAAGARLQRIKVYSTLLKHISFVLLSFLPELVSHVPLEQGHPPFHPILFIPLSVLVLSLSQPTPSSSLWISLYPQWEMIRPEQHLMPQLSWACQKKFSVLPCTALLKNTDITQDSFSQLLTCELMRISRVTNNPPTYPSLSNRFYESFPFPGNPFHDAYFIVSLLNNRLISFDRKMSRCLYINSCKPPVNEEPKNRLNSWSEVKEVHD